MAIIKVLGVDPSLTHTGWAVAEIDTLSLQIVRVLQKGTIITAPSKLKQVRKSSDDLQRARDIADRLRGIVNDYKIKVGSSEIPSGAQSANAAKAFGIVIGLLAGLPCPLIEVTPTEVKMATVGSKTADKEDMVRWAVEKTKGDDITWQTSNRANDWQIEHKGGFVTKTVEHEADAIAGIEAALRTPQMRQLAGMLNSLVA